MGHNSSQGVVPSASDLALGYHSLGYHALGCHALEPALEPARVLGW